MDTQKLVKRERELDELASKLSKEIENLDKSIVRLQQERLQTLANANAVAGAKQVLNELLSSEPAIEGEPAVAEVVPMTDEKGN